MSSITEEQAFETFLRAERAIKDILFMYYTCVDYSGLFDDFGTEWGEFDPFEYIDFNHESLDGYSLDIKLLNEGSAIKIACEIFQTWGLEKLDVYWQNHYNQITMLESWR